jgi:hypothetical protein
MFSRLEGDKISMWCFYGNPATSMLSAVPLVEFPTRFQRLLRSFS